MKWVIIPTTLIEVYLHNIYDIYTTKKLFCCGADKFQYLWCIQRFCPARLNYLLGRIWSHISTTSKENTFFASAKEHTILTLFFFTRQLLYDAKLQ